MRFNEPTLWGRDDEMDEYGDSGAYGESLEENFDEEEEEEETSEEESCKESKKESKEEKQEAPLRAALDSGGRRLRSPLAFLSASCNSFLSALGQNRLSLDFHEHLRRYQCTDDQHAGRGANVAEKLSVGPADFFPIRHVGYEHAGAHDVFERSAGF